MHFIEEDPDTDMLLSEATEPADGIMDTGVQAF